jgi:hypothetical protein
LQLARVVLPGHTEHDHPLRLDQPLDDFRFPILGISLEHESQRINHFLDRLMELGLRRVLGFDLGHQV